MASTALQLFCLPYSGASAMFYLRWRCTVPKWLHIVPVELPGRGTRYGEPFATDLQALATALASQVSRQLRRDAPYALFGHSLGGLLAFELTRALRRLGFSEPAALFVSGTSAPTQRRDRERGFDVPKSDAELISDLRKFQGTTEDVLAHRELMMLTLPILRADFLLCGCYAYRPEPRLGCSVHVLSGRGDDISCEQLMAWQRETTGAFSLDTFAGGHFFLHVHEQAVLDVLCGHLNTDLCSASRNTIQACRSDRP